MSGHDDDGGGTTMEFCRHLRWKSWSRQDGDPAAIVASLQRDAVPYTCLRTCQSWGPDDDIVAPERCCTGRACYRGERATQEDLA